MRARSIKPGFFVNEDLAECTPFARLCFIGLWMLADREGRLEDRPKRINGELFTFDDVDIDALLAELVTHGFIIRYRVGRDRYIQVLKFRENQSPHYAEKASVIPGPLTEREPEIVPRAMPESKPQTKPEAEPEAGPQTDPPIEPEAEPQAQNPLTPDCGLLTPDSGLLTPDSVFPPVPTGPPGIVDDAGASPPGNGIARCPTDELVGLWHELCAPPLPTVGVLSPTRRKAVSARWREVCSAEHFDRAHGVDWFRWLFAERIATSPFLMGRVNGRGEPFRASWDWVMRPTNFAKVVDGNYANRNGNGNGNGSHP